MNLLLNRVTATFRTVYVCDKCGAKAEGSTYTLESDTLNTLYAAKDVPNNHMPTGWAGYGRGAHRCPACVS